MNLRALANALTGIVHPNETITLYKANGQVNTKGIVKAIYLAPITLLGNIQPLDANTLKHLEAIGDTAATSQAFLNYPVNSTQRVPNTSGGDILKRSDGTYWLVTSVLEDWNDDGWCNVGITLQVTPPDFSASDWSDYSA